ncbi:hypothetical protein BWQ96_08053 [Gracilariopsis chorda]|uniref:Uncharacterized protein n=1 Tax=Gracilariopsis chorda TaxID=448386 RepID=A0A2V3IJF0_9FLOR|nr:hypothetical protein BWQ96_08053 [Gracilariopsis chorda]|eukprot:PXF42225.1 hypothetical protein BWQ96_08053 [Gracilariopsis chorda]
MEAVEGVRDYEDWRESNARHSTGGWCTGHAGVLRGRWGEVVRFYLFGFGSEV